jgi:hypothetical protein
MDKETKKEKKKLEKDLMFYLNYFKELSARSERMRTVAEKEIENIVERLKEIGH